MALPIEKLGTTYDPRTETIDADRSKAYAAATNDDNPAYESGKYAPPVFGVVPTWEAMGLAVGEIVPAEALMMIVHGEQDMHFHQPLVPGMTLTTRSQAHSVRSARRAPATRSASRAPTTRARRCSRSSSPCSSGAWATATSGGPDKPDHTFPEEARGNKVGELTVHVDDDQTFRYRDASGDQMPIHVDDAFAKSVGLPGHHRPRPVHHGDDQPGRRQDGRRRRPGPAQAPGRALLEERVPRQRRHHHRSTTPASRTAARCTPSRRTATATWSSPTAGPRSRPELARLRLFAAAREAAGVGRAEVEVATVEEVLSAARPASGPPSPPCWRPAACGSTASRPTPPPRSGPKTRWRSFLRCRGEWIHRDRAGVDGARGALVCRPRRRPADALRVRAALPGPGPFVPPPPAQRGSTRAPRSTKTRTSPRLPARPNWEGAEPGFSRSWRGSGGGCGAENDRAGRAYRPAPAGRGPRHRRAPCAPGPGLGAVTPPPPPPAGGTGWAPGSRWSPCSPPVRSPGHGSAGPSARPPVVVLGAAALPAAAAVGIVPLAVTVLVVVAAAVVAPAIVGPRGRAYRRGRKAQTNPALTVAFAVGIGLAAAAPVLVRQRGFPAALVLVSLVGAYDASAYLVGSGASSAWEGPAAGVAFIAAMTLAVAAVFVPPFSGASPGAGSSASWPCRPSPAAARRLALARPAGRAGPGPAPARLAGVDGPPVGGDRSGAAQVVAVVKGRR